MKEMIFRPGTVVTVRTSKEKPWAAVVFAEKAGAIVVEELLADGSLRRHMLPIAQATLTECVGYTGLSGLVAYLSRFQKDKFSQRMIPHCRSKQYLLTLVDDGHIEKVWRRLPYNMLLDYCLEHNVAPTREMIEACVDPSQLLRLARERYLHLVWDKIPYDEALLIGLVEARRCIMNQEYFFLGRGGARASATLMADIYRQTETGNRRWLQTSHEEAIACYKATADDQLLPALAELPAELISDHHDILGDKGSTFYGKDHYSYVRRRWFITECLSRGHTLDEAFLWAGGHTPHGDRYIWVEIAQQYRHHLGNSFWDAPYDPPGPV